MDPGNNENMQRCYRIYVSKSYEFFILKDDISRYLAVYNLTKNTIRSHKTIIRKHVSRDRLPSW